MKRHEAKATKEAAAKLPVGFISQDVHKRHEGEHPTTTTPPKTEKKTAKDEGIPFGFIAEDVKKAHTTQ